MAWLSLAHACGALVVVLVVVPRWIFPGQRDPSDPVANRLADAVRMIALLIAAGEVLAVLGLFQWAGLAFAALAVALICRRRRAGARFHGTIERTANRYLALLYVTEAASTGGNIHVRRSVRKWFADDVRQRLVPRRPDARQAGRLMLLLPLAAVTIGTLALRSAYGLAHETLVPADGYRHLADIARLHAGQLFYRGVAPAGFAALFGSVARLTGTPAIDLVRFGGAVLATTAALVTYAIVLRAARHPGAALAAAGLAGLGGLRGGTGLTAAQQLGALPEQLGLVLALTTLYLAMTWAATQRSDLLRAVGYGTLSVAMVYPPALGVIVIGLMGFSVVAAARARRPMMVARAVGVGLLGAAAGALPIAVGLAAGRQWVGWDAPVISEAGYLLGLPTPLVILGGVGAAAAVLRAARRSTWNGGGALGVVVLMWYAAAAASRRFDAVPEAVAEATSIAIVALGLGLGLSTLHRAVLALAPEPKGSEPRRALTPAWAVVVGGLALTAGLAVLPPHLPDPAAAETEYESSARVLAQNMRGSTDYSFTVVGPPTWGQRVMGTAYRADLAAFAGRLSLSEAADPGFALPVPSTQTLVLTEKEAFPTVTVATSSDKDSVYSDPNARAELMTRISQWMNVYQTYHHDARVVFEDDRVRVWLIDHTEDRRLAKGFGLVVQ